MKRQKRDIPKLPHRQRDAHKGDFGRVLVIGGSRGMIGAPALVANAALRAGAGLVTVACPRSIQPHVATLCPCATSIALPEEENGQIAPHLTRDLFESFGYFSPEAAPNCVAIGPGLGRGDETFQEGIIALFEAWSDDTPTPLVIDADALNAMTPSPINSTAPAREKFSRAVLTPHPGEMAHLLATTTSNIQSEREASAMALARRVMKEPDGRAVVVLKGHQSVITDGHTKRINKTGNPGMATGGSGDVLTGIIAGLIAQGMDVFDAAVLGTHIHGLAGDLAAKTLGQTSMIASDLVDYLPKAFRQTAGR